MKAGFVNIFGRPNAGKSSLLNLLMGEKLAIVSSKVQTTRHRIKGILSEQDYQIVFSDTPGIIEPKYKLHERMMQAVKASLVDVDVALLVVDIRDKWKEVDEVFTSLALKTPSIVLINKVDKSTPDRIEEAKAFFGVNKSYGKVLAISAFRQSDRRPIVDAVVSFLPEGNAFFNGDELSDLPTKFFVSEMIREKIYELFEEEIPYQTTVLVQEFQEKTTLTKIRADIIVQRETQKAILLGEGGKMIKKLGTEARKEIEQFLQRKIFLELFVKVKPNWRENDLKLQEYGY